MNIGASTSAGEPCLICQIADGANIKYLFICLYYITDKNTLQQYFESSDNNFGALFLFHFGMIGFLHIVHSLVGNFPELLWISAVVRVEGVADTYADHHVVGAADN